MNKTQIKLRLNHEITKTVNFINDCKLSTKVIAADCAVDHSLRMEKLNEDELTLKTLRKAEQKLINLKRVLNQINSINFGICTKCKSPIPIERIIIRPESMKCINCAY